MSIFDVYPDNEKRAKRVQELGDDCSHYFNELYDVSGELVDAVNEFDKTVKAMLLDLGIDSSDSRLKTKSFDLGNGLVAEIGEFSFDFIAGFITHQAVELSLLVRMAKGLDTIPTKAGGSITGQAITRKVGTRIEYQGASGLEEIAISKLKFPKWTRFKAFAGGMAAALVITIAIDTIISALVGGDQRDKLRNAIKDLYGPRIRTKMALNINKKLVYLINKTMGSMSDMKSLGYTEEMLNKLMAIKVQEVKKMMEETSIPQHANDAYDSLSALDHNRGSFTDDDKMDGTNCTDVACWTWSANQGQTS